MSSSLINRKHFVTDAIVRIDGRSKKCRLSIDLDVTKDGFFLISFMACHRLLRQYEFSSYRLALSHYMSDIQTYIIP